jgi:hypothetical protein
LIPPLYPFALASSHIVPLRHSNTEQVRDSRNPRGEDAKLGRKGEVKKKTSHSDDNLTARKTSGGNSESALQAVKKND